MNLSGRSSEISVRRKEIYSTSSFGVEGFGEGISRGSDTFTGGRDIRKGFLLSLSVIE